MWQQFGDDRPVMPARILCSSAAAWWRIWGPGVCRICLATAFTVLTLRASDSSQQSAGGSAADLKRLSLEDLSRIEVTSPTKAPTDVSQTSMAIYVITGEDIRRSGATSIPEVLRLAPGVEVARIEGSKWSVGIRGFGSRLSRSVLVLIDGRTVYTTFFAGTYWEVQDTLLEDIGRIEVIRGPGGTIWGPNAVNGVINMITKSAKDTHGTLVSLGGGSEEQGFFNFRHGGGNGRNLNYRVYGKGFTRSPEFHSDGRNFDDWRAAQTGFRVDWNKTDRDAITFQGDLYKVEAGQSVQAVTYTPPFSRIVDATAPLSGGNIMGRWTRTLSEGNEVAVQAFYDRTNRFEANFGENRDTADIDFLQRSRITARQQLIWGLGARFSAGRATEIVSGLTFDPLDRTDHLLTGFLQDEIEVVRNRLFLTLGTKALRTNFTGLQFEPSARLLWTPTGRQTFWTAYTRAVRTPSRAERDFYLSGYITTTADGSPFFARFNANRNFQSEQLNGYELGYRRLVRRNLYIDVASFYNHYDDLFSQEITGGPFVETTPAPTHVLLPAQFGNGLFGTTTGIEVAPEWRPTEAWRLRASYSYLNMRLDKVAGGSDVGTAPGLQRSSPRHQGVFQSAYDLSKTLQFDLTYRYVSALPGQRVPSYSTGDARLGWRLGTQLELSFVGQNLLQPSHPEFLGESGLVGIRRSAYLKLTWLK
jgi:iron complex outermembrane recepter protein